MNKNGWSLATPLVYLAVGISLFISSCSNKHLVSIAVTPQDPSVAQIAQTLQFTAMGTTNHANAPQEDLTSTATWGSSTASVATIDASGLATATGCGTTTITAKDGSIIGQTELTVSCSTTGGGGTPVLQSINLYPSSPTIPQTGQTTQFIALGAYTPATTNNVLTSLATWSSSNTAIATVNSAGLANAVSCGTTTITATYQGIIGQTQLTVSCTIAQTPVLQSITLFPSSPTIPQLGQTTQFIALAVYSPPSNNNVLTNVATWASSNTAIATVSSAGLATAVACGTTTITAEYQGIVGQMLLTVQCTGSQTLQSIAVLPNNPTVPQMGQTTQFLALGTLVGGGQEDLTNTSIWSSSNTQVATVNSSGLVSTIVCGTSTISANYQPAGGTALVATSLLTVSCNSIISIELLIMKSGSNPGTVTSTPTGIDCGTVCGGLFNEGTGFVLVATPTATWTGCDQVIGGECYFTLVPDVPGGTQKSVTAAF
ncbi:MAG TPA: Ig-like domain-containing protein [Candidatus Sulfotelmatobacter sp.]|nr:Ig-like domain-containing protein [Candidatus Sulfotelmatobacter sp.]